MNEPSQERLLKDVQRVLRNVLGIPDLSHSELYARLHDDHDGTFVGELRLLIRPDGDFYVEAQDSLGGPLRFRHPFGGTQSPRTYTALMILAYAMKLDNQDHPQPRP